MKKMLLACALMALVFAGCSTNDTAPQQLSVDVGVVKFVNATSRGGVQLELITEGGRRLLIANDAEVYVQRPDFTGFSNTSLWQLGAGATIKYEFYMSEVSYAAPDYPEYVVHKIYIYDRAYAQTPAPTESE